MRKLLLLTALLQMAFCLHAQEKNKIPDLSKEPHVITNLKEDSVKERVRASLALRNLKNGSVIVRLKTNQKSVDAYRKAGKEEIADRIELDRKNQNLKMYYAFTNGFHFCNVYFIYATETHDFLNGKKGLLLNRDLAHDPNIIMNDTNFIFCEYGSAQPFSKFNDLDRPLIANRGSYLDSRTHSKKILDTIPSQTSTSPIYGLFFSDKNLKQFYRPFPYVEDVYFSNYDRSVHALSRDLERAYERLVINKDFKDLRMKERKRQNDQLYRQ